MRNESKGRTLPNDELIIMTLVFKLLFFVIFLNLMSSCFIITETIFLSCALLDDLIRAEKGRDLWR